MAYMGFGLVGELGRGSGRTLLLAIGGWLWRRGARWSAMQIPDMDGIGRTVSDYAVTNHGV